MPDYLKLYYNCPAKQLGDFGYNKVLHVKSIERELTCDHLIDGVISVVISMPSSPSNVLFYRESRNSSFLSQLMKHEHVKIVCPVSVTHLLRHHFR